MVICTDFKSLLLRFQEILAHNMSSFFQHELSRFFLVGFGQVYFPCACAFLSSKHNWKKYTVLFHFSMIIESKLAVKVGYSFSVQAPHIC